VKLGTIFGASILLLVSFQANAEMSFTKDASRNIVSWDGHYFVEPDGSISSIRGDFLNWPGGNARWKAGAGSWNRVSPLPIPAAFWLFGAALIGFVGIARRTQI
jgi:hypothetical protein